MENSLKYISTTSILPNEVLGKDIVFVSKAAMTESTRLRLNDISYKVLPDIWDNHKKHKEGSVYLEKLYGNLTKKIGFALSKLHNVDYPYSFWELPMASWLLFFLPPLFDRYSRLKHAIELYGRENMILLACRYKLGPYTGYPDFMEKVCVIEQSVSAFYGEVANKMGIDVEEFYSNEPTKGIVRLPQKNLDALLKLLLLKVFNKLKKELWNFIPLKLFEGKNILMEQYKFNEWERFILAKELKASFLPSRIKAPVLSQKVDRSLLLTINAKDEFEKVVIGLLPRFMPEYLLEYFGSYAKDAEKLSGYKAYFFTTSWVSNILFSYTASFGKMKGAKIIACQHGGGYGQHESNYGELIERNFSDFFITWGWKDTFYPGAKIMSLPQPDLSRIFNKHKPKLNMAIWVSNSSPKHVYRFLPYPFMPEALPLYFNFKRSFLSSIDSDIRKYIVYRPYLYDYGWGKEEKEIFKEYPDIRIECTGELPKLLKKIRFFICDHLTTSFMEALVANTPSILFWNYELCRERKDAKSVFDLLRKAEILFHDPIDAANQVNFIWDDVQGWWMEPKRQEARLKFMEKFCWADTHWQERWTEAFKEIAR